MSAAVPTLCVCISLDRRSGALASERIRLCGKCLPARLGGHSLSSTETLATPRTRKKSKKQKQKREKDKKNCERPRNLTYFFWFHRPQRRPDARPERRAASHGPAAAGCGGRIAPGKSLFFLEIPARPVSDPGHKTAGTCAIPRWRRGPPGRPVSRSTLCRGPRARDARPRQHVRDLPVRGASDKGQRRADERRPAAVSAPVGPRAP